MAFPTSVIPWTDKVDNVDDVMAADVNTLAAEVRAVEDDLISGNIVRDDNLATTAVAFTEAATLADIASGDTIAVLFGKFKKWYTDFADRVKAVLFGATATDTIADTEYIPVPVSATSIKKITWANFKTILGGLYAVKSHDHINLIINGNFDVWLRGTTQTLDGYGSDDKWVNNFNNSTRTHSQQSFTLGQTDVPGNPTYFSRTVVTSGAAASSHARKHQNIEGVSQLSGKTVTLAFWAKADSNKEMSIEYAQIFGTGGSTTVTGIGVQKIQLTNTWANFIVTATLPSIAGKTLGADHHTRVTFWFEAGTDYNARTDSLGNQSGTFDIAQVQINFGAVVLPFIPREYSVEEYLCQRYQQIRSTNNVAAVDMRPLMRLASPTITAVTGGYLYDANI